MPGVFIGSFVEWEPTSRQCPAPNDRRLILQPDFVIFAGEGLAQDTSEASPRTADHLPQGPGKVRLVPDPRVRRSWTVCAVWPRSHRAYRTPHGRPHTQRPVCLIWIVDEALRGAGFDLAGALNHRLMKVPFIDNRADGRTPRAQLGRPSDFAGALPERTSQLRPSRHTIRAHLRTSA